MSTTETAGKKADPKHKTTIMLNAVSVTISASHSKPGFVSPLPTYKQMPDGSFTLHLVFLQTGWNTGPNRKLADGL